MSLAIYNTLSGKKEPLVPLEDGKVSMYVCGMTVYDLCHLGHARACVAFDVVQRYLRYAGWDVKFVRNVTDVDDKIIARANERGLTAQDLADRYAGEFCQDMAALDVQRADVEPRVSTHMPAIIEMVEKLVANGHAYVAGGDVFFDVPSFPPYGALSRRRVEELQAGARVDVDERKRHPADFALWKAAKPGEPAWESPWGGGRPGWHIECSAMSTAHLGEVFDIHGGGVDLVFPHHENEIAQSQGASGKRPVRYWMHNGHVNVNDEKMSKSLGNFFTIREVLGVYHPQTVRLFLLSTHYRSPINYAAASLDEADRRVTYLYDALAAVDAALCDGIDTESGPIIEEERVSRIVPGFKEAMDDDFNTPRALAHLGDVGKLLNDVVRRKRKTAGRGRTLAVVRAQIRGVGEALGVLHRDPTRTLAELRDLAVARLGIDAAEIDALVAARTAARDARDFARADELRAELAAKRIEVMDGPQGTTWRPLLAGTE